MQMSWKTLWDVSELTVIIVNVLFIYLLTSKQCLEQYVGQTIDDFRFGWNNYKDNNRKY